MNRFGTFLLILATCTCLPAFVTSGQNRSATAEIVTILPEETEELLANPGIGWETFGRTRDKDRSLPDWIPSTVRYERWGWGVLEPRPGEIDYAFLDKIMAESHAAGQKLAFRVMCCSTSRDRPYHPDWLEKVGCKVLTVDYEGREGFRIPDLCASASSCLFFYPFVCPLGCRNRGPTGGTMRPTLRLPNGR